MATAVDNRFAFTEHDTKDAWAWSWPSLDLTGYAVTLHIGYPDCSVAIAADIYDPVNGKFRFVFTYTDLRAGSYAAQVRFVDPLGAEKTIGDITLDIARRIKG